MKSMSKPLRAVESLGTEYNYVKTSFFFEIRNPNVYKERIKQGID
jgi:hypothetical protein